jgi:ParB family chromosome partitioning protein
MGAYWAPSARSYFWRVTKARIGEAVREAVSEDAAQRIAGLKKPEMAQAAEELVAATGWLPPLLRTVKAGAEDAHAPQAQPDPVAGDEPEAAAAIVEAAE